MAEQAVVKFYLYVVNSPQNAKMVTELRRVLEKRFKGNFVLDVVDILDDPESAEKYDIIATPTLIKSVPPPSKRFVGDFSNGEKVLRLLELT